HGCASRTCAKESHPEYDVELLSLCLISDVKPLDQQRPDESGVIADESSQVVNYGTAHASVDKLCKQQVEMPLPWGVVVRETTNSDINRHVKMDRWRLPDTIHQLRGQL